MGILAWILTESRILSLMEDALFYEQMGYQVARDWLDARPTWWLQVAMREGRQAWLIVVLIGIFYYALQGIRAVPLLILAYSLVTAFVPVLTYRITRQLGGDPDIARRAALLIVFSPAFAILSGALYKEGLILLLLGIAVSHALQLQEGFRSRSLLWVVGSVFALLGLRFYMAILMAVVISVSLLLGRGSISEESWSVRRTFPVALRQVLIGVMFVSLLGFLGFQGRAQRLTPDDPESILRQIYVSRQDLAKSAYSGYLRDVDISTPDKAIRFLPRGLAYFLTVPLPWQTGRIRQNLVIPETLFWVLSYPFAVSGFRVGLRMNRTRTLTLGAISLGICVIYSLLSGNIGVAYRMRAQVWLLWAPLVAIGWHEWRRRRVP
jgi:hypothetical protein